jgi:hypothetical protein
MGGRLLHRRADHLRRDGGLRERVMVVRSQPMSELLERLKEESLQLARRSFDSADAGISANLCDEAIDRIQALEATLQVAQELFAIVVNPQDRPNTSVHHLWAQCVEVECKIRDLLKDGSK